MLSWIHKRALVLLIIIVTLSIIRVFGIDPVHTTAKMILGIISWWLVFCGVYLLIRESYACRLKLHCLKHKDSQVLNIIIPGFLRPPVSWFSNLAGCMAGNVEVLTYDNVYWNDKNLKTEFGQILAEKILIAQAANKPFREIRIFAISIGNKLIANLEIKPTEDLKIRYYAVNPCINASDLRDPLRKFLQVVIPIASVLVATLGPIGDIPLIEQDSIRHSLNEVATEGLAIAFDRNLRMPLGTQYVFNRGVKDGTGDEFTDLRRIKSTYINASTRSAIITAEHAAIIKYEGEFLGALLKLGAFDAPKSN